MNSKGLFRFAVLMTAATLLSSGCIESLCERDADCSDGTICLEETGQCVTPECVSNDACPSGTVCEDYACVEGCRTENDCEADQICHNNRCTDVSSSDCPLAPSFCQLDINPSSPTEGDQVCVPASYLKGVAMFFGSMSCGTCRGIFEKLVDLRLSLASDGADLSLMFVQMKTVVVPAEDVGTYLGVIDAAVVQDTNTLDIAASYGASQYDLVIVDAEGCLADHFESLTSGAVAGEVGQQIGEAWVDAASTE